MALSQEDAIRHNTNQSNIRETIKALTPMAGYPDGVNDELKTKATKYIHDLMAKIETALPDKMIRTVN